MKFKKGSIPWNKGKSSWNKGLRCIQISEAKKGCLTWNKGLKGIKTSSFGQVPWNKIPLNQKEKIFCLNCKKVIYLCPYQLNKKFCSRDCQIIFSRIGLNDFHIYRRQCLFKFNVFHYPKDFDLSMINKYGFYRSKNRGNNPHGVNRDHMFSIKDGFKNKIKSEVISHPANCKLLLHQENIIKHDKSSITLKELYKRIDNWNMSHKPN